MLLYKSLKMNKCRSKKLSRYWFVSCCTSTDDTSNEYCNVHDEDSQSSCSCDMACHRRNDCCQDAKEFCVRKSSYMYLHDKFTII